MSVQSRSTPSRAAPPATRTDTASAIPRREKDHVEAISGCVAMGWKEWSKKRIATGLYEARCHRDHHGTVGQREDGSPWIASRSPGGGKLEFDTDDEHLMADATRRVKMTPSSHAATGPSAPLQVPVRWSCAPALPTGTLDNLISSRPLEEMGVYDFAATPSGDDLGHHHLGGEGRCQRDDLGGSLKRGPPSSCAHITALRRELKGRHPGPRVDP